MTMRFTPGSGRARCQICNNIIEKDTCDVVYSTYQHETHHHAQCIIDKIDEWRK